jgi:hypothetical protein
MILCCAMDLGYVTSVWRPAERYRREGGMLEHGRLRARARRTHQTAPLLTTTSHADHPL